jgi:UDP-N-acetylmuramoyl-tripeptide--D-alanyl-D-alanine ligase
MRTEEIFGIFRKATGVSTDSRTTKPGELFFALSGPNFDGNRFAAAALKSGAIAAIIDDPDHETENTILVDDSLRELQLLATQVRNDLKARVIAVTGSNGKTTTRELIAAVLSTRYNAFSTPGNLNNHIGLPLTILAAPSDSEFLVVEMGANHVGEIARLCTIARPDTGVVTNIGSAHIEGFGSLEGVIRAKSELYEYLRKTGGVAFYDDHNELLTELIYKMVVKAVPYSDPTGTDIHISIRPEELFLSGEVYFEGKKLGFSTNLFGEHNRQNIRAALAVGLFHGVTLDDAVSAIEKYVPENNRSQVVKTASNTLICDSYNANPVSMANAIKSFASLPDKGKVCILGDMLELGPSAGDEHNRIMKLVKDRGLKDCITVGPVFSEIASFYGYPAFDNVVDLVKHLSVSPIRGKTILVKGSRAMRLEEAYSVL